MNQWTDLDDAALSAWLRESKAECERRDTGKINLREKYRRRQATCPHEKRDARGMCYRCGHVEAESDIERARR